MEKEELVVCDSDVLIEVLDRSNNSIENRLIELGTDKLSISSITYSEVVFGAYDKQHQKKLINRLNNFILIEIDSPIDFIHRELIKKYSLSHKLSIQDAIVAATALKDNYSLYTLNKKDFKFIEGLKLI
jgi:tRNA(fMet)-specific endonuclease VapC